MARKVNKKERLARVIAQTLISLVWSENDAPYDDPLSDTSCDLLLEGFSGVVAIIRSPELDTEVLSALERQCKFLGASEDMVERCYARYTCW